MSTQKHTRCKRGTRRNKKTGKCENVLYNTCAICLGQMTSHAIKTKCKHQFHKNCLIGWCKSKEDANEQSSCPICRNDIKATCSKIMPFNSSEVFRYLFLNDGYEKVDEIIRHSKFDINIKNVSNESILSILSHPVLFRKYYELVEYLLQKPNIIITDADILTMIKVKSEALSLYKKYKKIPKALKNLI